MNVGIVRFDDFHKLIECHQVALIEGSGKSYIFSFAQIFKRHIFGNGQDRNLIHLDHFTRDTADQVHIFLALSTSPHHDQ